MAIVECETDQSDFPTTLIAGIAACAAIAHDIASAVPS
jgi:hypothetical protein